MAKKARPQSPPSDAARENVLAVLQTTAEPKTPKELVKLLEAPFQITEADLAQLLEAFANSDRLFRFPKKTDKSQTRYWDRDAGAIAREAIQAVLDLADRPLTAKEIAGRLETPLKFTVADLAPLLQAAADSGLLHRFDPTTAKGLPRYWSYDEQEYGRRVVLQTLKTKGPLARTKLQTAVKGISKDCLDAIVATLTESGQIHLHPPLKTGAGLLGVGRPVAGPYLKEVGTQLAKVTLKLRQAGVTSAELRRAVIELAEAAGIPFGEATTSAAAGSRSAEVAAVDLLALMKSLDPGAERGALVGARDLRRVAGLSKSEFDSAVLQLARQGRLSLHAYDLPASLNADERNELVTDGSRFYVGIAIRQNEL